MGLSLFARMLVDALLNPFTIIFALLLLGSLMMVLRHDVAGRRVIYAAAVYVLVHLILPIDLWAERPLEERFPPITLPDRIDGIVVLEGGTEAGVLLSRGAFPQDTAVLRLIAAGNLFRRFPNARFIHSGRLGARAQTTEAVGRAVFGDLGIDPARVTTENKSANTWQNILFSKELAQPKEGENWILVTSAVHMPRAMGVAQHLGWKLIPWPSDYITRKVEFPWMHLPEDRMRYLRGALHEWAGLLAYRLAGRTDTLFPGSGK